MERNVDLLHARRVAHPFRSVPPPPIRIQYTGLSVYVYTHVFPSLRLPLDRSTARPTDHEDSHRRSSAYRGNAAPNKLQPQPQPQPQPPAGTNMFRTAADLARLWPRRHNSSRNQPPGAGLHLQFTGLRGRRRWVSAPLFAFIRERKKEPPPLAY